MQKLSKITKGLWHIEKFLPDEVWNSIRTQILSIPDNEYSSRHEPMRNRLAISNPKNNFYHELLSIVIGMNRITETITNKSNLRNPPGLFLWRDLKGFKSDWHPDDFTRLPTMQIYIDGDENQGTSFKIDDDEITIPFRPNTGYLIDNQYQILHGMLTPVQEKIRQSIYLIY